MRLLQLAPLAGLLASVHAGKGKEGWGATGAGGGETVWTTVVVPTYTTYCPVCLST